MAGFLCDVDSFHGRALDRRTWTVDSGGGRSPMAWGRRERGGLTGIRLRN